MAACLLGSRKIQLQVESLELPAESGVSLCGKTKGSVLEG